MNEIECKVCSEGSLVLRELPKFPSPEVQRLGGLIELGATIVFVISAMGGAILFVALLIDFKIFHPGIVASALGLGVEIFLGYLLLRTAGALLTMEKPTLQYDHCSATISAS